MGTQHRTAVRVPERRAEEPRSPLAQRDLPFHFTRDIDENRLIVSYTPADLVSQNKNSTGAPMMMKLSFRPLVCCRRLAGAAGRTQAS